jgi:hypothetical protein
VLERGKVLKSLKAVLFSAALLVSTLGFAQDRQEQRGSDRRDSNASRDHRSGDNRAYYDSKRRDWHQWDDQENQSYRRYAEEHHWKDHDFSNNSEREQQQYWNWQHKHPDSH